MEDALPPLLMDPPWQREAREAAAKAKRTPLVPGLAPPAERHLVWEDGERERWLMSVKDRPYLTGHLREVLHEEGWAGIAREVRDGNVTYPAALDSFFGLAPEELARPLLAGWRPTLARSSDFGILKALPARFGLDARHIVLPNAKAHRCGWALMPFLDTEVARLMADWLRLKSARSKGRDWFRRHGLAAVPFLVPAALDRQRIPRDKARAALVLIAADYGPAGVVEAARRYGDETAEAIGQVLGGEEAEAATAVPAAKPPKVAWLDRDGLPQVRLLDGRVLPPEAVDHLIGALVLSPGVRWMGPATIYPGLDEVLDLCDRESLAAFGRALFEAWLKAGTPGRSGWVLDQFCWLADDEAVRRFGTLLLRWPARGTEKHAAQVLREIGTDTALIHLHRVSERVKAPGLRETARQCLELAAGKRNLTRDELDDRLVPDLGLDPAGTLVLDYGPRRFTVGFDERLAPFVVDEAGKPRKALPKPGAGDDADLASDSYRRFGTLKKEVRGVAVDQVRRLERAMIVGRRWSTAEFRRYFVEHPLLWHIARRLVWTADGAPFRLAEDRTPAGVDDRTVALAESARIGIPHPLTLGDAIPAWSEVFADYEITQPFPQLGRPVHALTDGERRTGRLERFEGTAVTAGAIFGLSVRGWLRGPVEDGGVQASVVRPVPDGPGDLVVGFEPGIPVAAGGAFPEQKLREIRFTRPPGDAIDPVIASEILADLAGLA